MRPENIGRRLKLKLSWPQKFHDQIEDLEHEVFWDSKKKAVVLITPQAVIEYTPPPTGREPPGETSGPPHKKPPSS
jgi:hypothetical protein